MIDSGINQWLIRRDQWYHITVISNHSHTHVCYQCGHWLPHGTVIGYLWKDRGGVPWPLALQALALIPPTSLARGGGKILGSNVYRRPTPDFIREKFWKPPGPPPLPTSVNFGTPGCMKNLPTTLPDIHAGGPAFDALNNQQKAFVLALVENGGNQTRAAITAGYSEEFAKSIGSRLARNPKVTAAIKEMADQRVRSSAVNAMDVIIEIMRDPTHKDRFKAAIEVANRSGLIVTTQHEVKVAHTVDDTQMVERIRQLATGLGLDAKQLLGSVGVDLDKVIDAEFTEVTPPAKEEPEEFEW